MHEFIAAHERVYVVEQNRDAQMLQLLKLDLDANDVVQAAQRAPLQRAAVDARSVTDDIISQEGK